MTPWDVIGALWMAEYDSAVQRCRRSGVGSDSEDVVMDCFLRLAADELSPDVNPAHALNVKLMGAIIDYRRHRSVVDALGSPAPVEHIHGGGFPAPDSFLASTLDEALYEQPRQYAQAFILLTIRGASPEEAACLLGINRATVYRWADAVASDIARRLTP